MDRPPTRPAVPSSAKADRWSLEVVRGRDVGRAYALEPGESILGNALNGERGLDLLDQEGSSPRRMAARHAALSTIRDELSIRDLESPGGTFVNQQRLLAGQSRRLVAWRRHSAWQRAAPGDAHCADKHGRGCPSQITCAGVAGPTTASRGRVAAGGVAPTAAASTTGAPAKAPVAAPAKHPLRRRQRHRSRPSPGPRRRSPAGCRSRSQWPAEPSVEPGTTSWCLRPSGGRRSATSSRSGRLAEYLRRIQRTELVPHAAPDRSPDDRLDEWLARLPATVSSAPELDVHPESLLVNAAAGGGVVRQSLRVTNVGYRLLQCTARVEPPGTSWVRLRPEHDGRPFQTIEQTELPIEVELPEKIDRPLRALIVIESNGGTRRIEVRIERPGEQVMIPESDLGGALSAIPLQGTSLSRKLAGLRPAVRIAVGCAGAIAIRLLVALVNLLPIGSAGAVDLGSRGSPRSRSSWLGLVLWRGCVWHWRRGERRDLPAAGFAGAAIGLLAAAVWFAVVQSVERVLGTRAASIWAVGLLWGAIGALLALLSTFLIPHRRDEPEVAR